MRTLLLLVLAFIPLTFPAAEAQSPVAVPPSPDMQALSVKYAADLKTALNTHQLTIKGFFLGMSKDEVKYVILSQYANEFSRLLFNRKLDVDVFVEPSERGRAVIVYGNNQQTIPTQFNFDAEDRLINFRFDSRTVNMLFNVSDLDMDGFTQAFAANYSVPAFAAEINDQGEPYYRSTSDAGFEVLVLKDKVLILKQIPKPSERKFN